MRRIEGPDRPKGRRRVGSFLRECVRDRDKYAMLLPFLSCTVSLPWPQSFVPSC